MVKTKINGVVTGARIVSEEFKDGTYHVVMAAPLYGIGSVGDVAIRAVVGNNEPQPMPLPLRRIHRLAAFRSVIRLHQFPEMSEP